MDSFMLEQFILDTVDVLPLSEEVRRATEATLYALLHR